MDVYNLLLFSFSILKAVQSQVNHNYHMREALQIRFLLTNLSFRFSVFLSDISLLQCLDVSL